MCWDSDVVLGLGPRFHSPSPNLVPLPLLRAHLSPGPFTQAQGMHCSHSRGVELWEGSWKHGTQGTCLLSALAPSLSYSGGTVCLGLVYKMALLQVLLQTELRAGFNPQEAVLALLFTAVYFVSLEVEGDRAGSVPWTLP